MLRRGLKKLPELLKAPGPAYLNPETPEQHYRIAVYFADDLTNMYQMRQWYGPLQQVKEQWPVVVIARRTVTAHKLAAESGLDVIHAPRIDDIEQFLSTQRISLVLYVNQNTRNFQMLRYGDPVHVFIGHGESDKAYMVSNQIKAYDYAFIAGRAAAERLQKALRGYDVASRTVQIGRPQVAFFAGDPPYPKDGRTTVFYAPTWEGDRESMAYGSIKSHGANLVRALLADSRYRVVYRPHPRSGIMDPEYGSANEQIKTMIENANRRDPSAHHVIDREGELTWQLREPDLVVCDVSAMLYDRLAVGKPLLVTRPLSPEAVLPEDGYLTDAEWLTAEDSPEKRVREVLTVPESRERLQAWAERYFGAQEAEQTGTRFGEAVARLIQPGS